MGKGPAGAREGPSWALPSGGLGVVTGDSAAGGRGDAAHSSRRPATRTLSGWEAATRTQRKIHGWSGAGGLNLSRRRIEAQARRARGVGPRRVGKGRRRMPLPPERGSPTALAGVCSRGTGGLGAWVARYRGLGGRGALRDVWHYDPAAALGVATFSTQTWLRAKRRQIVTTGDLAPAWSHA